MSMPVQKPGRSKQNYGTPVEFIRAVKHRLNIREFAIDFAADADNFKGVCYLNETDDALSKPFAAWANPALTNLAAPVWHWLNPPFANIAPWAAACAQFKRDGGQIAFLVPASVGANWFRDHVHGQALVLALNGRLAFIEGKPNELYPKDCVLCLYSPWVSAGFDVWDWKKATKVCCQFPMAGVQYRLTSEDYDGVSEWRCDTCGKRIGRWSGRELREGELEQRYGGER